MSTCQFCGDDHAATHEVYIGSGIWLPACEDVAEDVPPTLARELVHTACSACGREIERTDRAICEPCEGTARKAGGPYTRERHEAAHRFKRHGMEG